MEARLKLFAESEDEIRELEYVADSTVRELYGKGYMVSSDVFIRLMHKVSQNPLMIKLL